MAERPEIQLPNRGDTFIDQQGVSWLVIDLTTRYIKLLGETGTREIPTWDWPGQYRSESEAAQAERPPIRALLVGGAPGRHMDRLEDLAGRQGVDIVAHWPNSSKRIPRGLPSNIDVVIILVSHIDHCVSLNSTQMASKAGVTVLLVPSAGFEHSLASELRTKGVIKEGFGSEPLPVVDHGTYEWTGDVWTWRPRSRGEDGSDWESIVAAGVSLLFLGFLL